PGRIPFTKRDALVILPGVVLLYGLMVAAFATFGEPPVCKRFRAELQATGTAWEEADLKLRRPPDALEEVWRATAGWRGGGEGYVFIGRLGTHPEGYHEVEIRLLDPQDTGTGSDKAYLAHYSPYSDELIARNADERQLGLPRPKVQEFYRALKQALRD